LFEDMRPASLWWARWSYRKWTYSLAQDELMDPTVVDVVPGRLLGL
jgi:hypothetical protein